MHVIYSMICISGDQRFEDAALKALDGLWKAKSNIGLVIYLYSSLFLSFVWG
jgi:hypothetical protein